MFNFAFALVDPVGFRLTKWNVNRFYYRVEEGLVNGFRLTMWYVNEICMEAIKQNGLGFILTMWIQN